MESTINPRVDLVRREAELRDLIGASIAESIKMTKGMWGTFDIEADYPEEQVPFYAVMAAVGRALVTLTAEENRRDPFPLHIGPVLEGVAERAAAEAMGWRKASESPF